MPHKKLRNVAAAVVKPAQRLSRKEIKANELDEALKAEQREAREAARKKEEAKES